MLWLHVSIELYIALALFKSENIVAHLKLDEKHSFGVAVRESS